MAGLIDALHFLRDRVYKDRIDLLNNFKALSHNSSGCFVAVDGGSCVIVDGGAWLVAKLKVAIVHYDAGKRVPDKESVRNYYYTVVKKGDKLSGGLRSGTTLEHNLSGEGRMPFLNAAFKNVRELEDVPAIVMRTLEFVAACDVVKGLPAGSLLVIDGLLTGETDDEVKAIAVLESESKARGVNVIGLAKTFRHAINGRSVIGSLLRQNKDASWFYAPVEGSDCFVVKLHAKARYAYAFNAFKHTKVEDVLPVLAFYSRDPELLGYPYPLLKVDRDARISGYERKLEMNKLKILSRKEGMDFIETDERSTSMHALMDSAKYR